MLNALRTGLDFEALKPGPEIRAASGLLARAVDAMVPMDLDSSLLDYRLIPRPAGVSLLEAGVSGLTVRHPGNGKALWKHSCQPEFHPPQFAVSSDGGMLAALDQSPMSIGILDTSTGDKEATLEVQGDWFLNRTALEFSRSGRLLATFENQDGVCLMCFEPGSDQPQWTASLGSDVDANGARISSAADDSVVVVGLGQHAVAVDEQTGAVRWRQEQPKVLTGRAPAMVADGRVYSVESGALAARSADTGELLWSGRPPQDPTAADSCFEAVRLTNELSNLTPVSGPEGLVFTLQGNVEVVAFRPDGGMAWHTPLPSGAQWPPAVSGNSLFVVTTTSDRSHPDSTLHVLDAREGHRLAHSEPVPGRVRAGLTTSPDGHTYLGLSQGLVSLDQLEAALDQARDDGRSAPIYFRGENVIVGGVSLRLRRQ